jgi:hypothetical protein
MVTARALAWPKAGHAGLSAALVAVGRRTDVAAQVRLDALAAAAPAAAAAAKVPVAQGAQAAAAARAKVPASQVVQVEEETAPTMEEDVPEMQWGQRGSRGGIRIQCN